ncbi:class III lanthionine synthetase LanKC [Bacillus halotolerans]|uniref:class III lanthionine synthetase LanKC n=1 Tax=Bacillus halotolerans TaxID=260554 RepID=UPI001165AB27|nr:class III lanthionine synthetase LanKC [Bacillus halotolerans]MBV7321351.1 class III lanthionine synthetase LanKC [Halalkalibacterium halodurans]QDK68208.1 protein kinase [Bacillus halotolerans]QNS21157.1 class III lanthionine synthetase LanKC [Bacillus halotolerans]
MDKKLVYFQHMSEDSKYYIEKSPNAETDPYEVHNMPNYYTVSTEYKSPWKFYNNPNHTLKEQGWKIHISATMNNAQDILKVVSQIIFKHQIPFKHIKDKQSLFNMNSKHGNRTSSGKFIAIYPSSDNMFFGLLNELYEELKHYENGPYILNDKSWKDSNIYYRYGAFKNIYNERGELCIKDENGNLIPDNRQPYYKIPEFVSDFDQYLDTKNNLLDTQDVSNFNDYEFQGVLRFNNGGGIYTGIRKSDGKKVVIKEGRPKVGLDGQLNDAIDRLNIEYEALNTLTEVEGVVNVLDYFKAWKHVFLVEEFVEGVTLQSWCAINYPFNIENDKNEYISKVKKIINSLIETIKLVHSKDVGMGDLQPQNIMITPESNVKIIDFEAASALSEENGALQTIGYTNKKNKNHKERDWYALKKVLRFCILPIGPVTDIEESIKKKHDMWIENEFGKDVYQYVVNTENLCDRYLSDTKEKIFKNNYDSEIKKEMDMSKVINGLRNSIESNMLPNSSLIHGDVRQFVMPSGKLNVLTGGTGAALALYRSGNVNKQVRDWIENVLLKKLHVLNDDIGLFTGRAGIAATLYELGYIEEAMNLFNNLSYEDMKDISLRSGLSGIGLSLISLYLEEDNDDFLVTSEKIADQIENRIIEDDKLSATDFAAVPIGLIDGWSGISLFYAALYSVTKKEKYYVKSKEYIEWDLKHCKVDEETNTLQTYDDQNPRLLPYLSGGSIGIGVAIWYLNYVGNNNLFREELEQIINLNKVRIAYSGGLFDGVGSFLLIPSMTKENNEISQQIELALKKLELFLIRKDDQVLFPGNFSFRLADDYYSGSAGIILGINSIKFSNPLYWLPIIKIDSFLNKTKKELLLNN